MPTNRRSILLALLVTALVVVPGTYQVLAQDATPDGNSGVISPMSDPIALGVMVEIVDDRTRLDATIEQIGRDIEIVMFHTHWGAASGEFDGGLYTYVDERGGTPMVTWEAWRPLYAAGVAVAEQPEFSLDELRNGTFDDYIDSWADGLAEFGEPVFLRFGHEMNGDWYPWSIGVNGNTAEDFVETWQYIHQRFEDANADNVLWVWSPIADASAPVNEDFDLVDVYPGDEYVDWIGMSGFNWGTTQQPWGVAGWQTFSEVFATPYEEFLAIADKPIVIAEMASAENGGDKAEWITSAFLEELPDAFPEIRAIVWFNIIKEADWRFDSSTESLRAFVASANSPYLLGELE